MKLSEENISFIYENINALFPLNLMVINNENSIIKRFTVIELPDYIKGEEKEICKIINAKFSKMETKAVYKIESSKRLIYMGFGVYEDGRYEGNIILGPFLKDLIPSVLIEEGERFFYEGISVIGIGQQKAMANMITNILNASNIIHAFLEEEEKSLGGRQLNYTLDDYETNLTWIKELYKMERNLLYYVSQGNKKMAMELIHDDTFQHIYEINRFPDNPIRYVKNLSIVLNTLLRKAIESSGVDVFFIHSISETFAIRIENSLTIRQLINLIVDMIAEYCDTVNEYNVAAYSDLVSKAITYIKLNFKKDISLASISKELFIHPTYLAKKFKQETGGTISEYINQVRIKEAQFIIKSTEFKIEDIAYYVGYNDKKYFSKTFKKVVGISPSEYRKYNSRFIHNTF